MLRQFTKTDIKIISYLGLKRTPKTEKEIRSGIKHKFYLNPHLSRLEDEGTLLITNEKIPYEYIITGYGKEYFNTFKRLKKFLK